MTAHRLLYLSRADVEAVALDVHTLVGLIEAAFSEKGQGRVEMPPKPGIHPRAEAFIHAMPAHIPALGAAGVKWVSGYPDNHKKGLPYISGLLILNDPDTGLPQAVMDCTWITAWRTAAASALAARHLARPGSEVLGILACGVQGRTHVATLTALFPVKRILAYDVRPEVQQAFVEDLWEEGLDAVGVTEPRAAVADADIVVTSGPILLHPAPTIAAGWLRPGAFASAVDFDSYWTPEALAEIDRLATDDHDQFRYYRRAGYFQKTPDPYADLGEIVVGARPGRQADAERTLAMNLGLALEDMAVAPEIHRRAREAGLGTWLPL